MEIRRVQDSEIKQALDVVLEVFMEFEAPDYPPEGVASFVKDVIENDSFKAGVKSGSFPMFVALVKEEIVGVMTMRKGTHIMLAFVKKQYHKQGIGKKLFEHILGELRAKGDSELTITVNSSPYAVEFYKKLGFVETDTEQEKNGIRFTPMEYVTPLSHVIRKATSKDISRIAEILVFVKRIKFRPIFQDDDYSFGELQVLSVAEELKKPELLEKMFVYDDGIVKGFVHIDGNEIVELYVDYFFQGQGVGAALIEFAKENYPVSFLWAIEKNVDAIRFYARHGFHATDIKKFEEGTTEYLVMLEKK
jgi:putative acetyltransferase